MLWRHKTNRINVPESRNHKLLQILRLVFGGDEICNPLPRVPGTLDQLHNISQSFIFFLATSWTREKINKKVLRTPQKSSQSLQTPIFAQPGFLVLGIQLF